MSIRSATSEAGPVEDATRRAVTARLAAAGVPSPEVDARWLIEHVGEVTARSGRTGSAGEVTGCGAALLDGLVTRRCAREPLQLVTGRTWFRTLELTCRPGVFVPRPETEVVVEHALRACRDAGGPGASSSRPARGATVLEPCTGTGAIAASLVAELPGVRVIASDRDAAAVALARHNLRALGPEDRRTSVGPEDRRTSVGPEDRRTSVVIGELLDGVDPALAGHVDVLVANPPYLPARDRDGWAPEVADHDPEGALVAGPDGHELVEALLALAARWLRPGGTVVLEIDARRGDDARAAAGAAGLVEAAVAPDLTGRDRVLIAHRAQ